MTDDVVIEPVTVEDLDRVLQIARMSFSTPWTRTMFEVELTGNPFAHLVAVRPRVEGAAGGGGRVLLGYLCFWLVFEELRLMDLAVDPAARRRGLARALVVHALRDGAGRGAGRAVLEVRASNAAASALYRQLGFRRVALRAGYYSNPTEDAVLMELASLADFLGSGGGGSLIRPGGDAC